MKTPLLVACAAVLAGAQAVTVRVLADSGRIPISPWIYGRNNSMSDDSAKPVSADTLARYREAGLRMLRENGGNNSTKYNWSRKLTSHPDWYNNVYAHDWDYTAKQIQANLPGTQGLFAFQLLGWAAGNTSNNWGDYTWGQTHGGSMPSAAQNLAGGGVPDTANLSSSAANKVGDPSRYLVPWPADSTAGILDHWFGTGGIGLEPSRFQYWNMDNEPDIWSGTHDDVVTDTIPFETYFQKYLSVAKAVRARNPDVKLVGPVIANEWQWWTWNNLTIDDGGVQRSPMEMFIKRVGQEEKASGLRLLDVFDLHFYPGYNSSGDIPNLLQSHRIFFDTAYAWPGANGIHMYDNNWHKAAPYYLFLRAQRWMEQYLGDRRGVSMTEFGAMTGGGNANAVAATYASWLGTFADHGGELLTAWDWYPGMWEVLHLFSRYAHETRVKSVSGLDSIVSAYSSISSGGDSLTVILVNRDQAAARSTTVSLTGFDANGTGTTALQMSGLAGETFVSHAKNALKSATVVVTAGQFITNLPALSVTAVILTGKGSPNAIQQARKASAGPIRMDWSGRTLRLENGPATGSAVLRDLTGGEVRSANWNSGRSELDLGGVARGVYVATWNGGSMRIPVVSR
jgi:hypothetical protein